MLGGALMDHVREDEAAAQIKRKTKYSIGTVPKLNLQSREAPTVNVAARTVISGCRKTKQNTTSKLPPPIPTIKNNLRLAFDRRRQTRPLSSRFTSPLQRSILHRLPTPVLRTNALPARLVPRIQWTKRAAR